MQRIGDVRVDSRGDNSFDEGPTVRVSVVLLQGIGLVDETDSPQLPQQLTSCLQDRVHGRVADEVVVAELVDGIVVGLFLEYKK